MKGFGFTITSLCLLGLSICAYGTAIIVLLLNILGNPDPKSNSYLLIPDSIQAGMIANACGAIVAIVGLFKKAEKKWTCGILLVLNAIPPVIAWGMIVVGFILIG